ncbi:SAM-dependent methyltransferase [Fusobacterium necrophorum]|uniref:SAM-dependent methyltransferase n=1 Tax=Fusobacterium necrophorum TaxID=859 RepID=UPI0021C3C29D|nr:SAM-dependent methyltransferase [Fusobacterium necrophorum]
MNNILEKSNIGNIVEEFRNRSDKEYFSRYVDEREIEENDYSLSVSTYVEKKDTRG